MSGEPFSVCSGPLALKIARRSRVQQSNLRSQEIHPCLWLCVLTTTEANSPPPGPRKPELKTSQPEVPVWGLPGACVLGTGCQVSQGIPMEFFALVSCRIQTLTPALCEEVFCSHLPNKTLQADPGRRVCVIVAQGSQVCVSKQMPMREESLEESMARGE